MQGDFVRKKYGPNLLLEQVFEHIAGDWEWLLDEAKGDSKIEKLLFRALVMRADLGATEYNNLVIANDENSLQQLMAGKFEMPWDMRMIVYPQAPIENRRVDFLILARDYRRPDAEWRRLIIECDGHDFHALTKEQVARDRSKDRKATLSGYDFFRFTGSEIWRDPWGCAEQITEWAATGLL